MLDGADVGVDRAQASLAEYVRYVMAQDRKLGPMKSLQVRAVKNCCTRRKAVPFAYFVSFNLDVCHVRCLFHLEQYCFEMFQVNYDLIFFLYLIYFVSWTVFYIYQVPGYAISVMFFISGI